MKDEMNKDNYREHDAVEMDREQVDALLKDHERVQKHLGLDPTKPRKMKVDIKGGRYPKPRQRIVVKDDREPKPRQRIILKSHDPRTCSDWGLTETIRRIASLGSYENVSSPERRDLLIRTWKATLKSHEIWMMIVIFAIGIIISNSTKLIGRDASLMLCYRKTIAIFLYNISFSACVILVANIMIIALELTSKKLKSLYNLYTVLRLLSGVSFILGWTHFIITLLRMENII